MITDDYGLEIDAQDPEQRAWAEDKRAARELRARALWRIVLSTRDGREFVSDVLLTTLGDKHHIDTRTVDQMYRDVAYHNLACTWLGKYILEHADYYKACRDEALAREASDRKELAEKRAAWRRGRADAARQQGSEP